MSISFLKMILKNYGESQWLERKSKLKIKLN